MICPKCSKGEIKEQISIRGTIFNRKKEITYFCPLCDFEKIKIFKISKQDEKFENIDRINKPKISRQEYYSEKKLIKD